MPASTKFVELTLTDGQEDEVFALPKEFVSGRVLTHITLGFETGSISSSIFASAMLEVGSTHVNLVGGWIWYPPVTVHADDLTWDGRMTIPASARLRFRGTNLTGLTKTIRCSYVTEDA